MEKVDDIGIGVHGTLEQFKKKYTVEFLERYGYTDYYYYTPFSNKKQVLDETVQTKYGELVVHNLDVLTYVGDGIWSVSRDEIQH